MPYWLFRFLVNRLVRPLNWANRKKKQTMMTRLVRWVWSLLWRR